MKQREVFSGEHPNSFVLLRLWSSLSYVFTANNRHCLNYHIIIPSQIHTRLHNQRSHQTPQSTRERSNRSRAVSLRSVFARARAQQQESASRGQIHTRLSLSGHVALEIGGRELQTRLCACLAHHHHHHPTSSFF
jgi:hypothetical protein